MKPNALSLSAIIFIACLSLSPSILANSLTFNLKDTIPPNDSADKELNFGKVDIEAKFPGGESAWLNFLSQNLNGDIPVRRNAPAGKYTVQVQFVIDKEGHISDIKALTNMGYGMEEEVFRILRMSPTWRPASISGKPVKAYRRQPVTFVVKFDKNNKNS